MLYAAAFLTMLGCFTPDEGGETPNDAQKTPALFLGSFDCDGSSGVEIEVGDTMPLLWECYDNDGTRECSLLTGPFGLGGGVVTVPCSEPSYIDAWALGY